MDNKNLVERIKGFSESMKDVFSQYGFNLVKDTLKISYNSTSKDFTNDTDLTDFDTSFYARNQYLVQRTRGLLDE